MEVSLLDIGCGGGLVTEPMSRLGARVTGIDAAKENVEAARIHGASVGLSIDYYATSAEDLAQSKKQYDVVLALEIIEHVANVPHFMQACCDLVAPGGVLIMSTINRTVKSYLLAIVGAEYILRWLPIGTHDWSKFLAPSSIAQCLRQGNLNLHEVQGMSFKPLKNEWYLSNDTQVNYLITAYK
jgi:2-polyprenyl-6-hydroxyphenyl methylase/3-demethylubiquinone-9 3-methyltransferase